jgi:hypothetical protein
MFNLSNSHDRHLFSLQEVTYDFSFHVSEDIGSHYTSLLPIAGKCLSSLHSYIRKYRVGASKGGAKNSALKKTEEGKTHGNN